LEEENHELAINTITKHKMRLNFEPNWWISLYI